MGWFSRLFKCKCEPFIKVTSVECKSAEQDFSCVFFFFKSVKHCHCEKALTCRCAHVDVCGFGVAVVLVK